MAATNGDLRQQQVHVDEDQHRFSITVEGTEALVDYTLTDGIMAITHTLVPPEIGGRGIAGRLVEAAFEHARANGWRVRPVCSYAEAFARRHPEYADLIA